MSGPEGMDTAGAIAYHDANMSADPIVFTPDTVVVAATGPVACEVDGAYVILEPAAGRYFGTENVGASIWRMLAAPVSVETICRRLVEQYDVQPERCEADVRTYLGTLHAQGLVEICASPAER